MVTIKVKVNQNSPLLSGQNGVTRILIRKNGLVKLHCFIMINKSYTRNNCLEKTYAPNGNQTYEHPVTQTITLLFLAWNVISIAGFGYASCSYTCFSLAVHLPLYLYHSTEINSMHAPFIFLKNKLILNC